MEQENIPTMSVNEERPGILEKFLMVFASPAKLFSSIGGKYEWMVPFVVIIVIGATLSQGGYFIRPIAARDMYPVMMRNIEKWKAQMSEERFNEVKQKVDQSFKEAFANPIKWYYIPLQVVIPFIIFSVIAGIGLLFGNFMFGGRCNFWTVFTIVAFAALIGSLGDLIKGALMIAKNTSIIYTGLGLLKPEDDGSFIYYLFRQIDLFAIWNIAITSIGFSVAYKMKPKRFAFVFYGMWFLFISLVAAANLFTGGTIVY